MLSSWALSKIQNEADEFVDKVCKRQMLVNDSSMNIMTPDHTLAKKLGVPSGEGLIKCVDNSLRGNGSCGFIITERGIYCKAWLGITKHFISFERLARVSEITVSIGNVEADGELVASIDNFYGRILYEMIENIRDIARQDLGM